MICNYSRHPLLRASFAGSIDGHNNKNTNIMSLKGYSVGTQFGQQRKSSFVDPLSEPAKRKLASDGSTKDSTSNIFSQGPPFPHLDSINDKKHSFKPYEASNYNLSNSTNNSTKTINNKKLQKKDTPKRLPKLENISGSLKLTSKTEVIEIIAEKPHKHLRTPYNRDIPFQVHKMEATNPHSYYSKLPNLSSLGLTTPTLHPTISSSHINSTGTNKLRHDPKHETDCTLKTQNKSKTSNKCRTISRYYKPFTNNTTST